jgi:hypothetical protein
MNDFCQQAVFPRKKGLSNPDVPEQKGLSYPDDSQQGGSIIPTFLNSGVR